ncbi:MAG: VIT1/CCC1 transporter family protein [Candidatus Aenigmarchaeota archaeon]|nr:VIT1/CCC1 transporter family protein [Candidatus Aenigmarchaeota archaeon]
MKIKKNVKDHMKKERSTQAGSLLRQVILGGQDGLVNVLGLILGVAAATNDARIVIIAGLAATMAESISMAAVAYTSSKAEKEYYQKELAREMWEIRHIPEMEREEIKIIYYKKGFRGKQLSGIVRKITSDKKLWLDVMMSEELGLAESRTKNPIAEGVVVGLSALIGSLIPLAPFFFLAVSNAMAWGLAVSILSLFIFGAIKSKITVGHWARSGIEMAVVGTVAAILGYLIGVLLGSVYY